MESDATPEFLFKKRSSKCKNGNQVLSVPQCSCSSTASYKNLLHAGGHNRRTRPQITPRCPQIHLCAKILKYVYLERNEKNDKHWIEIEEAYNTETSQTANNHTSLNIEPSNILLCVCRKFVLKKLTYTTSRNFHCSPHIIDFGLKLQKIGQVQVLLNASFLLNHRFRDIFKKSEKGENKQMKCRCLFWLVGP